MDVKNITPAPFESREGLASLGAGVGDVKLRELNEQSAVFKKQLKELKKGKAEISRQFKSAVIGSLEHSSLIASMQTVSAEIKRVEEQLKACDQHLSKKSSGAQQSECEVLPPFVDIPPDSHYPGVYVVRELEAHERDDWYKYIQAQRISAYHQPVWSELIEKTFHHPTRIWVAVSTEGRILGGIPLTFFSSALFGRFAVSLPYFNYGGVITRWLNVARDLLAHMKSLCVTENLSHIEVRTMQAGLGEQVSNKKVSMVLLLPESDQVLEEQLGAKVRAQYKKAEEHHPVVKMGKQELLDDFYEVFSHNMRDLGTPVYAKNWFAGILKAGSIQSQIIVVYVKKVPVSAGFLIGYGEMLEIPWASTVKRANALNTNMWMYRQILGYAIKQGYKFFDFGRSTRDAGTYKFKKQWGAKPYMHHWYYVFPEQGSVPELNPENPKYKLLIKLWKLMPVWLTKIVGPPIVANLP